MCKLCADALNEHWGHVSEDAQMSVLWICTAFPAGCGETVARQLKESKEKSGGNPGLAMKIAEDETEAAMQEMDAKMIAEREGE